MIDPPVTSNADGPVTVQYSREMNSLFPLGSTVVVVTASDSTTAIQCNFEVLVQGLCNFGNLHYVRE